MIITPEGTIQHLRVEEHLQRQNIIYQDPRHTILLTSNKQQPFAITEGNGDSLYIDLFAFHFGLKEQLYRRTSKGLVPLYYGCERAERDRLLYLPVEDIVEQRASHTCCKGCQYYSPPVGVKSRYVLRCILARYRAFEVLDFKSGLTLEEVGRIYGCTRERIRQIEEKAMQKMRHMSRLKRLKIFHERVADHRDYYVSAVDDTA